MAREDLPADAEPPEAPRDPEARTNAEEAGPVVEEAGVEVPADGPAPEALEAVEHPVAKAIGTYSVDGRRPLPKGLKIGVSGAPHHRPAKKRGVTAVKRPVAAAKQDAAKPSKPVDRGPKARVGEEEDRDKARARKGALFLLAVLAAYVVWIVVSGQYDEFVDALQSSDTGWFVAGLLVMGLNFFFGSLAFVLAAYIDPTSPLGVRDCISVEANGVLFGNLTPMSTGTMPAQIFRLTQAGLDVGEASATQLTRFVIYQAGEVVVAAALLALRFDFFLHTYGNIVFVNIVVFIIQTAQALGLLLVCLFPRFVGRVGNRALSFIDRRGWLGHDKIEKYRDMLNGQLLSFGGTFRDSFRHKESLLLTLLVTLGQMLAFYAVPWFVLHAFGGDADFVTCLAAASMVQMIGNSVPLPGGAGGNEAGFALFFGPIFGAAATAGFVVWRLITFFIPTLVAVPMSALRSTSHRSIYQRWQRFRTHGLGKASVSVRQRRRRR